MAVVQLKILRLTHCYRSIAIYTTLKGLYITLW